MEIIGSTKLLLFSILLVITQIRNVRPFTITDLVDRSKTEAETDLTNEDFIGQHPEVNLTALLGLNLKNTDPTLADDRESASKDAMTYRNGVRKVSRRWPNGVVPYKISVQFGEYSRQLIARAMQAFHDNTCVRFVPRDPSQHDDYVYIAPLDGCSSKVGRNGGYQVVSLAEQCLTLGSIKHELNHVLGFHHEHSRSDRDDYVKILWDNIEDGTEDNFQKIGQAEITHLGEPYDYASIMHYPSDAFGKEAGWTTIVALKDGGEHMGQRNFLSVIDVRKIKKMYGCADETITTTTSRTTTTTREKDTDTEELDKTVNDLVNWAMDFAKDLQ